MWVIEQLPDCDAVGAELRAALRLLALCEGFLPPGWFRDKIARIGAGHAAPTTTCADLDVMLRVTEAQRERDVEECHA